MTSCSTHLDYFPPLLSCRECGLYQRSVHIGRVESNNPFHHLLVTNQPFNGTMAYVTMGTFAGRGLAPGPALCILSSL